MQTIGWYVWYQDSYSPVSWVRVRVKVRERVRVRVEARVRVMVKVRVRVRVPNLNPNRMYVTKGKCPRG